MLVVQSERAMWCTNPRVQCLEEIQREKQMGNVQLNNNIYLASRCHLNFFFQTSPSEFISFNIPYIRAMYIPTAEGDGGGGL